jgi:hypothetical protein
MATTIRVRIYACGEVSFAKFLFLPSWFAKLWRSIFLFFDKIRWKPSWFAKLLELLLGCHLSQVGKNDSARAAIRDAFF